MKPFNTIGAEEAKAALGVAYNSLQPLSGYIGSEPYGGHQCRALEDEWAATFGVKHAVAINSATSGLLAACMAVGITFGDEVIVSPYTMSATAAAPKILGANIVWADIEPDTFTLDPVEVSNAITHKTKAVIVTNLFGHPARLEELKAICDQNGVYLIEDNAQAIFATENGKYAGTIGHIGVFSLNVHKHLQVGEGGICVTNSDELNARLREAMNHGEMRGGILGLNLRMTEITAAMACEQLKKAPSIMARRIEIGNLMSDEAAKRGILWPTTRRGCTHSFYIWASYSRYLPSKTLPRHFKIGYQTPLYRLKAFGTKQLPLDVTENIEKSIIICEICSIDPTNDEVVHMIEELGWYLL